MTGLGRRLVVGVLLVAMPVVAAAQDAGEPAGEAGEHGESRITDELIPLQLDEFPNRPKPLLELGAPFLGTGRIARGFAIPGGAVWTPSFLLFGTFRTGLSVVDDGTTRATQWANRLDLFGNLYLSATERFVFGLRPTDETVDGTQRFSGYTAFSPDPVDRTGFSEHFNLDWDSVSHLFFEGDIGELFPSLDWADRKGLDIGFSVGRQPISFQEGLLVNDTLDAVGLTQTNFKPGGVVNVRVTGLYAWNQINRNTPATTALQRNLEADRSHLAGVFTEIDTRAATLAFDAIYVRSDAFEIGPSRVSARDGVFAGFGITGRPGSGTFNTALRVVTSVPLGEAADPDVESSGGEATTRGTLVFGEISWTPHHTENFYYANAFYAFDEYRAAALDPTVSGPLARAGILFAGPGLGNVASALAPTADDVAGGAFGHQMFFGRTRQQLVLEVAGRRSTVDCPGSDLTCAPHALAAAGRFQVAVGRRGVVVLDAWTARDWLRGADALAVGSTGRTRVGGRTELLVKF